MPVSHDSHGRVSRRQLSVPMAMSRSEMPIDEVAHDDHEHDTCDWPQSVKDNFIQVLSPGENGGVIFRPRWFIVILVG